MSHIKNDAMAFRNRPVIKSFFPNDSKQLVRAFARLREAHVQVVAYANRAAKDSHAIVSPGFDAASARRMHQNSVVGARDKYDGPSHGRKVSIEMNAKAPSLAESTILFHNVTYSVNGNAAHPIIDSIALEIHAGETLVLLGRSGSGKTTLLKLINRLLLPQPGKVLVQGRATSEWDAIRLRRGIGYVIQEGGLFPHFTVAQKIALVPTLEKWEPVRIAKRVEELLSLVGLNPSEFPARPPNDLSQAHPHRSSAPP